ncbi:hypothetical protein GQ43DRAFT_492914 [Delitschia confertaspora ATCC 74209]|uniref:SnoaL-like domain-containing protein n=1 Tax=Delitschia confertaspora ATCC 74209 TaxID=1513339 RepID=A0A9P4MMW8_9PLEO|nr:hypothetical protein GQ43DRAFT_492914 [Delitschia confertaspora ATCC 74209]
MKITKAIIAAFVLTSELSIATPTLNSLARSISRVESIREIKDVQKQFAQLAQFGRFNDMASLFTNNGTLKWGNQTAAGPSAIEHWLRNDAGNMNGIGRGSLNTIVVETPLVSLSVDGRRAKGRWNGLRFMGDGAGKTRIEGGIYENEFVFKDGRWKISLLHYHALYRGDNYTDGWRNVGGSIPIIPYHFMPESAGVPVPEPVEEAEETKATVEELAHRITRLNDEDEVRNLQHAYGFYVDRRMWTDVIDLFSANGTFSSGFGSTHGEAGIREELERQGSEGLKKGVLNDRLIFDTIVQVDPNGREAITRGFEIGMIGDAMIQTASWEFRVFRNHFIKENGLWKFRALEYSQTLVADYKVGWGYGGISSHALIPPAFINITMRSSQKLGPDGTSTNVTDLQRRLRRSAAFDGVENVSAAYGYYADDLQCKPLGVIHATNGHKLTPFTGFYHGPQRITKACEGNYGQNRTAPRSAVSFHWRPQSVVQVSEDGRSANLRARLLQPSTSKDKAGSFNGAIYHDHCTTIDEFYWQSSSWAGGWAVVTPTNKTSNNSESDLAKKFPPDLSLKEAGDRESTFIDSENVVQLQEPSKWTPAGVLLAWMYTVSSKTRLEARGEWVSGTA